MLKATLDVAVANFERPVCVEFENIWPVRHCQGRQFVSNLLAAIRRHISVALTGRIPVFGALDMATNLLPARWPWYLVGRYLAVTGRIQCVATSSRNCA